MRREEAEAIYDAGREAVVEALLAPAQVEELTRMIDALRERVEELERQLSRNSRNSSMPPSADPPMTRQQRRALARQMAKESLREQGAQPGHEGRTREMASPERVDERFEHLPHSCSGCGHDFNGGEERLGDPLVHQEWELAPISPVVFEHRLHRLRCPGCGKAALAELPAGVSVSAFGPRLEAHVATLAGVYRLSRRQVADVVREVFGIPISTGAVDKTIMRMSRVLADPWAELRESVRAAEVVHADETSWRLRGAQQWLWLGASALVACYRIDPSRSQAAAKELIGEDFGGFVISDRYAGYHFLDVLQQQLCWAHVIRQLTRSRSETGPPGSSAASSSRRRARSSPSTVPISKRAASSPGWPPSSPRCASASGRSLRRARAAATARPRTSAPGCSASTRRFGRSARLPGSTPPTTPPSGRSATP